MTKKIALTFLCILLLGLTIALIFLPKQLDKRMNPVIPHKAYTVSDGAQQLHDSLIVGDWHADTMLWNRDIFKRHDHGHVDIARLQEGNVALQMFTTVTKSPRGMNYASNSADAWDDITTLAIVQRWPLRTWFDLTERALFQSKKLHKFASANPDQLVIIKSQNDLSNWQRRRTSEARLIGGLIGTEGSHALEGKLENVQRLYDDGFRMMSLHHFFDNRLGGSLHGESQAGLTAFGKQAVQAISELNIILDLSHSSENIVKDVMAIYEKPIVISHTGFQGHCATNRNISDEYMQAIARKGGLIAIGYWDAAVCGAAPKDVVDALQYGLQLVGEDHLALGSDFDGTVETGFDTSELAALTQEMLNRNFTEPQIRKIMGGNMLRMLQSQLPEK